MADKGAGTRVVRSQEYWDRVAEGVDRGRRISERDDWRVSRGNPRTVQIFEGITLTRGFPSRVPRGLAS